MKWLIKIVRDEVGDIASREPVYRTSSKTKPRGGEYLLVEGVETKYPSVSVDGEGVVTVIENADLKEVKDKWKETDAGVIADAAAVYSTTREVSQLAFVTDDLLKCIFPEDFVSEGLVATQALGGFLVNDPLDTAVKIKDYYKAVLIDLRTKRNTKIADYLTLKASKGL